MKIKREVSLEQALASITSMVEQLQGSTITVGDHELKPDDPVTYELEIESGEGGSLEIEFEVSWHGAGAANHGGEGAWGG